MKQRLLAAVLTGTLAFGSASLAAGMPAPALANGVASTRNIIVLAGVAAVSAIVNYNHKVREKRAEQQVATRRQSAYQTWFYQKYGYYPTRDQFKQWYYQTYGVNPN
jgi:hypothetical protein